MSDLRRRTAGALRSRDFATGLIFAAVGLGFAVAGSDYGIGTSRRMGPGYFPVMIGGAMALIGVVLVARAVLTASNDALAYVPRLHLRPLLALTASVVTFALTINRFGIIAACLCCVLIAGLASERTRWSETVLVAAAMAVFSAVVFVQLLGLPMRMVNW